MHIAANYGFGHPIGSLEIDDAVTAVRNEMIGQTFAVIGMAVAKLSLGLFLARIVMEAWHKVAIWIVMGSLMAVSILTAIMFWTQCLPSASIYDPRVKGKCNIKITPFAILLGGIHTYPQKIRPRFLLIDVCSLVCHCGLFLCYLPMDLHLGSQHEAKGEDYYRWQYEFRYRVSAEQSRRVCRSLLMSK